MTKRKIQPDFYLHEFDRYGDLAEGSTAWNRMMRHSGTVQKIRDRAGVALAITRHGGFNGPTMDAKRREAGWGLRSKGSRHRKGDATDLYPANRDMPIRELHELVLQMIAEGEIPKGGVGLYCIPGDEFAGYVHVDGRGHNARFGGTP